MLHLVIEVIENYEGTRVVGIRKRGNGETRLSKYTNKVDLERLGDAELQRKEINIQATDLLDALRKSE